MKHSAARAARAARVAWRPRSSAQYDVAPTTASRSASSTTTKAAWARFADYGELVSTHGRLSVHGAPRRRRRLRRDGHDSRQRDVPDFPGRRTSSRLRSEFKILTIRLLGVLPFDNGISLLGRPRLRRRRSRTSAVNVDGRGASSRRDQRQRARVLRRALNTTGIAFAMRLGYEKYDFDGDLDVVETSMTFFYKL